MHHIVVHVFLNTVKGWCEQAFKVSALLMYHRPGCTSFICMLLQQICGKKKKERERVCVWTHSQSGAAGHSPHVIGIWARTPLIWGTIGHKCPLKHTLGRFSERKCSCDLSTQNCTISLYDVILKKASRTLTARPNLHACHVIVFNRFRFRSLPFLTSF